MGFISHWLTSDLIWSLVTGRVNLFRSPGSPEPALLKCVQEQFSLHPLAVEDATNAHQRPKLEQYGDALFVVARTAQLSEGRITFGETHIFVGRGYIVSVRHGASTSYTSVRQHWETCPTSLALATLRVFGTPSAPFPPRWRRRQTCGREWRSWRRPL